MDQKNNLESLFVGRKSFVRYLKRILIIFFIYFVHVVYQVAQTVDLVVGDGLGVKEVKNKKGEKSTPSFFISYLYIRHRL